MSLCTARDVATTYSNDVSIVHCHMSYLLGETNVTDAKIEEVNKVLMSHGLRPLPGRANPRNQIYSTIEAVSLLPHVEERIDDVWNLHSELGSRIASMMSARGPNTWSDSVETHIRRAIPFFSSELPTPEEVDAVRESLLAVLRDLRDPIVDDPITLHLILCVAQHRHVFKVKERVLTTYGHLSSLRWSIGSHSPHALTGIVRQSFILLLTHFDATMFDLMRLAFEQNFFGLLPHFGGRDRKVSFDQFGEHNTFEGLRTSIIDDVLKQRYVKDLVLHLDKLGAVKGDLGDGGIARIMEIIQRRNIHLHNRGVVDNRYAELGRNGQPKWNLDNLKIGDNAPIDRDYYQRAYNLCGWFIRAIADWIDAGAIPVAASPDLGRHDAAI